MSANPDAAETAESQALAAEYLTVALNDDLFALPVGVVREVLDPPAMTAVPNAPYYAPGLLNVRGNVVPLVDLRLRLGTHVSADTPNTRIIVSEVGAAGETFLVAMKADAVMEVIYVRPEEVEAMPDHGSSWPSELVDGVVRVGADFVVLLNVAALFEADLENAA
ncbi:chemotaxis protein CheW [Aurantimonas sp. Leaf443]|uniref:chemotaxis protein CheW n=1 Tax=Aurantimonas sp. Leaf443 TaxID=1736378 RepID=UPI0006FD6E13|nr:chemotaxis protein CheW [Aurantimonas sp. Leaf443]KQT86110.1 hypothetical protein ASG48_05890 [Aurantimonas sp. Leaf443]